MKRTIKVIFSFPVLAILFWQCREKYISPYTSPPTGYLVVEGYISGNGPTQFTLSHSIPLPGNTTIPKETNAQVQVEGDDNTSYSLVTLGPGIYGVDTLPLRSTAKYRLRIRTSGGETYLSDFVPFKQTPAIDSINWKTDGGGSVNIYANTHDPANTTHYYSWDYNETWEYTSAEYSFFEYRPNTVSVIPRTEQIYYCWRNDASTTILLGNSTKLARDVIYEQPLVHIPEGDQRLSLLYSILVRQYALTADGYNFLSLMQKNSESLGSIFDAQPSEVKGNIHSLDHPDEKVIGFVSAGTVRQQRIFINRYELPSWSYYFSCVTTDTLVPNDEKDLKWFFGGGYTPVESLISQSGVLVGWISNFTSCVDCRAQGGTTDKPSFWPN